MKSIRIEIIEKIEPRKGVNFSALNSKWARQLKENSYGEFLSQLKCPGKYSIEALYHHLFSGRYTSNDIFINFEFSGEKTVYRAKDVQQIYDSMSPQNIGRDKRYSIQSNEIDCTLLPGGELAKMVSTLRFQNAPFSCIQGNTYLSLSAVVYYGSFINHLLAEAGDYIRKNRISQNTCRYSRPALTKGTYRASILHSIFTDVFRERYETEFPLTTKKLYRELKESQQRPAKFHFGPISKQSRDNKSKSIEDDLDLANARYDRILLQAKSSLRDFHNLIASQ